MIPADFFCFGGQLLAKIRGKYWLWHPGRSLKGCRQRTGKTYEYYYFFIQDGDMNFL